MKRIRSVAGLALAIGALVPSAANAATVTVGSPLIGSFTNTASCAFPGGCTWANTALGEVGANAASPVTGVIVRWRITGSYSNPPFELRVLHPTGGGAYTGAGTSAPANPPGGTQVIPTNLPIQAGDVIGLDESATGHIGSTGAAPGSAEATWGPVLADGANPMAPLASFGNSELGFNADVVGQPGINLISPTSGSISGGGQVVIAGHDLSGASAVKFGPASASFVVNSDSQITATAPARASTGPVDITVTTVGGTSPATAAGKYAYTGCLVPKLRGKRLSAAKKALGKSACRLGKAKGPSGGTVKKQNPKPGTLLPPNGKVAVKLG